MCDPPHMTTNRGSLRPPDQGLKDAERDACLHALGELHASGHLTFPELETRIQAALAARSEEELAALVRDAPGDKTATESPLGGEAAATTDVRSTWTTATVIAATAGALAAVMRVARAVAAAVLAGLVMVALASYALLRTIGRRSRETLAALRPAAPVAEKSAARGEMVRVPQPQVPVQRQPIKVYAVRVPMGEQPEPEPDLTTAAARELPSGARPALPGRVTLELAAAPTSSEDRAQPETDEGERGVAGQLRPLLDRVAPRGHGRRSGVIPTQREPHVAGWRRTRRAV